MLAPKNDKIDDKPMAHLIPFDVLIKYLTPAYQEGLIKYEPESWRMGFKVSKMFSATLRHLTDFFYLGEDYDPEALKLGIKKHHLAGALFSILSMLHTLETKTELDDRVPNRLATTIEKLSKKEAEDAQ